MKAVYCILNHCPRKIEANGRNHGRHLEEHFQWVQTELIGSCKKTVNVSEAKLKKWLDTAETFQLTDQGAWQQHVLVLQSLLHMEEERPFNRNTRKRKETRWAILP